MIYNGISKDILFLMADNRFRNSKPFYEEHKEEIKQGITIPMRQIAGEIGERFSYLDPLMVTDPVKMVSRLRRDTRFTKDKTLYRDHMWIAFMRNKHEWSGFPSFWFEVTPTDYSLGVGFYGANAAEMQIFRSNILKNTISFKKALNKCVNSGGEFYGETYKRIPENCPKGLESYYGAKDFGFIRYYENTDDLSSENIVEIITEAYKEFAPMYTFLLDVAEEYFSKGE